jgi:hypothetical protein
MHEVVNVGKKKLITQFSWKSRDESFEPSWSTMGQYLPNKTKVVLFIRFIFFQSKRGLMFFVLCLKLLQIAAALF